VVRRTSLNLDFELVEQARTVLGTNGTTTRCTERSPYHRLEDVPIDARVWRRATDVFETLAAEGPLHHRRVALPGLVIAAAAEVADMGLCHYDGDFDVIAAVTGQPVRPIAPLGSL
jgi:predicted nucleic acid-binding protein